MDLALQHMGIMFLARMSQGWGDKASCSDSKNVRQFYHGDVELIVPG